MYDALAKLSVLFDKLSELTQLNTKFAAILGTVSEKVEDKLKGIPQRIETKLEGVINTIVGDLTAKIDESTSFVNINELESKLNETLDKNMDAVLNSIDSKIDQTLSKTTKTVQTKLAACCVVQ